MDYPESVYESIKGGIPAGLEEHILALLLQHVGKENRISRVDLVRQAFGVNLERQALANSTCDRQARLVLDRLQERYPILSSSGSGGYYYARSAAEIAEYAREIESRAKKLLKKSRKLARQAEQFKKDHQLGLGL